MNKLTVSGPMDTDAVVAREWQETHEIAARGPVGAYQGKIDPFPPFVDPDDLS